MFVSVKSDNSTEAYLICLYVFLQQFSCLLNLVTPSDIQSSVGVYVKTERFAPCLGHGKLDCKEVDKKIIDIFFSLLL